jgi:hypothetical protein
MEYLKTHTFMSFHLINKHHLYGIMGFELKENIVCVSKAI